MADVVEIIDYIKTLRKGFDKDLFQSKIDELANAVDTTGLVYEDFHTLFQVWLHLSLPISKWVSMGSCLAPPDIVEQKTVQYALRWILAHAHDQMSWARLGFLLDWLTVAMDCESIDMKTLDSGYDIFYNLLTFEAMTVHAAKLVYTLTKPTDVTRKKVIQLLEYASKREASKSLLKQLQVILGLFKSYKPDCVPEDIPAFPIYTAFKKRNESLYTRFKKLQDRRNKFSAKKQHLVWINPINSEKGRTKKAEPLVPNLEFINLHKKGDNGEPTNNFFDFSEPAALLQACAMGGVARPARLRALLCNGTGHTLLALQPHAQHAFLEHDLRALLSACFMEPSPYSYAEKADLLQKLVELQRSLLQGVPAVTYFLAHYLPFWNEADYFPQILDLCEWVSAQPEDVSQIAGALAAACLRAPRLRQAALLRSLSHMYTNLVYASTKSRQHFLPESPPEPANYGVIIPALAQSISTLCHKLLQVDPGCVFTLHMVTWSALHRARGERAAGAALGALPSRLALALPLLSASPVLIDNMAELIILYKKIMTNTKAEPSQVEYISKYLQDLLNCLYSEEALSGRHNGLVFQDLNPQLVDKLRSLMPDVDSKLSLRNHIAFSPLTYLRLLDVNNKDADNKMLFHGVLQSEFPQLGLLLKKTLPELRHH